MCALNRLLVLLSIPLVNCDYSMVVIWGRASNFNTSNTISTNSWNECVLACYGSQYCVAAAGDDSVCIFYNYNSVFEVEKLTSDSKVKVAMKVNSTSQTCSEGPYESSSSVQFVDPTYPYTTFSYEITYSSDTFQFTFSATRTCPPDWFLFTRPTTDYCLRLYGNPNATYSNPVAVTFCESQNATLAGLETEEERLSMTAQGLLINQQDIRGYNYSGFWVSGTRKSSCSSLSEIATAACNSSKAFDYTDRYLTNLSGYIWAPGNPDGVNSNGVVQDCIMLRTQTNGGSNLQGKVDDVQCTYMTGNVFDMRGFVCGKVPGI